MKVIGLKETNLSACVNEAQHEKVVITRNGKPAALIVGVAGLDAEQLELGSSSDFWTLIANRRSQRTITRAQLEGRIRQGAKAKPRPTDQAVASDDAARKKRSRQRG